MSSGTAPSCCSTSIVIAPWTLLDLFRQKFRVRRWGAIASGDAAAKSAGVGKAAKRPGRGLVDADVGRLGAEDRGDEEFVRRRSRRVRSGRRGTASGGRRGSGRRVGRPRRSVRRKIEVGLAARAADRWGTSSSCSAPGRGGTGRRSATIGEQDGARGSGTCRAPRTGATGRRRRRRRSPRPGHRRRPPSARPRGWTRPEGEMPRRYHARRRGGEEHRRRWRVVGRSTSGARRARPRRTAEEHDADHGAARSGPGRRPGTLGWVT